MELANVQKLLGRIKIIERIKHIYIILYLWHLFYDQQIMTSTKHETSHIKNLFFYFLLIIIIIILKSQVHPKWWTLISSLKYDTNVLQWKQKRCIASFLALHTNTVLSCIIISSVEICSFPLYTTLAFVWPSTNSTKLSLVQETVLPSTSYCTFLQHLRKIFRSPLKQTVTKKI